MSNQLKVSFAESENALKLTTAKTCSCVFNGRQIIDADGLFGCMPVGTVYIATADINPIEKFGGDWQQISEGRTLFGAGTLNGITYTADPGPEGVDGYPQNLISAALPNIKGHIDNSPGATQILGPAFDSNTNNNGQLDGAFYGDFGKRTIVANGTTNVTNRLQTLHFDASKSNSIYSETCTTVQPNALVVNIWERTN